MDDDTKTTVVQAAVKGGTSAAMPYAAAAAVVGVVGYLLYKKVDDIELGDLGGNVAGGIVESVTNTVTETVTKVVDGASETVRIVIENTSDAARDVVEDASAVIDDIVEKVEQPLSTPGSADLGVNSIGDMNTNKNIFGGDKSLLGGPLPTWKGSYSGFRFTEGSLIDRLVGPEFDYKKESKTPIPTDTGMSYDVMPAPAKTKRGRVSSGGSVSRASKTVSAIKSKKIVDNFKESAAASKKTGTNTEYWRA